MGKNKTKSKKVVQRNPTKLVKADMPWVDKLGKKRSKLVRKLVNKMHSITEGIVHLPFDIQLNSVDIVSKTQEDSWFHDQTQESLKLLVRLRDLDEDGLGRHLTDTAKVVQWILWVPLIGDPYTSRSAPDRIWRESTYPTPADFLLSYISTDKAEHLGELVGDRWDAGMMLGGAMAVRKLIDEHIRDDNEELRESITQWLKHLKWHQEWDWETLAECAMFGENAPKFDIFWESDDYEPATFNLTHVWSEAKPESANNVRDFLATVPGNSQLSQDLYTERTAALNASALEASSTGSTTATATSLPSTVASRIASPDRTLTRPASASAEPPRTPVRMSGWTGVVSPLSMRKVARYRNSWETPSMNRIATMTQRPVFRPDMPFDGANKLAFERYFERSPGLSGRKKRIRDYKFGKGSPRNTKKMKTQAASPAVSDEKAAIEQSVLEDCPDVDTTVDTSVSRKRKKASRKSTKKSKKSSRKPRAPARKSSRKGSRAASKKKSKSRSSKAQKKSKKSGKKSRRSRS